MLKVFKIYYDHPDGNFLKAAQTYNFADLVIPDLIPGLSVEYRPVVTKGEFVEVWHEMRACVLSQLNQNGVEPSLVGVAMFLHSSKGPADKMGLEFAPSATDVGTSTLTKLEIEALPRLYVEFPTASGPPLAALGPPMHIASCNSGLAGVSGWCPAQALAVSQRSIAVYPICLS